MVTFDAIDSADVVLTYDTPLQSGSWEDGPYIEIKTTPQGVLSSSGFPLVADEYLLTTRVSAVDAWELEAQRTLFLDNAGSVIMDRDGRPVESLEAQPYTSEPGSAEAPSSITWDRGSNTALVIFETPVAVDEIPNLVDFRILDTVGNEWAATAAVNVDAFKIAITMELVATGAPGPVANYPGAATGWKTLGNWPMGPLVDFPVTEI